ncbi:uncharacterized protein B0P05DRAFT_591570 [Gilbertella persicaria]|uniref:uncharacterized protein n=1 Tax=Gilbertella persicaria TaxID=101096 RepID=UPI00221F7026|nr:uncharacterized protein B0P05DRAFT_591570 [Gilbertella persicaria]KAI8054179.1 hypothetical protein B0P05DRAFT_591570 [Gilbertella persicaria]
MATFHPKTSTPSIKHKSTPIIATHSSFQPLEQRVHSIPQQQRESNVHQLVDTPHTPPSKNNSTTMSQVIAPIISVCGGIAIVAAVMFFVALKRKRQRQVRNNESKDDQNKFDDLSLSKEGVQPEEKVSIPKLTPLRQSMTDKLIESNTTTAAGSRTSSMTLANQPRPKSSASSSSTVYADALSSPAAATST